MTSVKPDDVPTVPNGGKADVSTDRPVARVARVAPVAQVVEISDDETDNEDVGESEDQDILRDYPDETEELELIHSRLTSLANLRLDRFAAHLKKLCLRQNFISNLDPQIFSQLTKLEELDVYDNKIKTVGDALNELSGLTVLDLSFNLLRAIPDTLEHLKSLSTIYFVQNRISHITGLEAVGATLRSLELGGNKIRKIENLDALVNLEELWLGKNKISKLENLGSLRKLKILALQSNRIIKIEGLENLENLEDLYLSHNGVTELEGVEHNLKLKTLDLGNNFIPTLHNVSHLSHLEELWLNNNKIPDLKALEPELSKISSLETIYLEGNPCQAAEGANYRRKIMLALPQLTQIDATFTKS
ncbi:hypothetical protein PLICRDRAFT_40112 [Plicaturopsis crispa FD-325 SS-3]|nr:hypothetical protein PLICRDRAFT_40112 [Plicaturopsis crispa FD-325 SS-3]